QNRKISAPRDAVAHDCGKLRNARGGNHGVIAKDATEIIFVWKNFILHRQEHASRIDEINNRQRAFKSDALGANQFFGRLRKERAGFYRRVVGDNHAGNTGNISDSSNRARGGNLSPLLVHFVSSPKTDLEKRRIFVEQVTDAFAHW